MITLVDTNMLVALAFPKDINHVRANQVIDTICQGACIVISPVLSELFYMITARINYSRAIEVFSTTRTTFEIEPLTEVDMARMQQIMEKYQDALFDFTDTAIMAIAERLNITRIATFDRRDFSMYRPSHCEYFEILP